MHATFKGHRMFRLEDEKDGAINDHHTHSVKFMNMMKL